MADVSFEEPLKPEDDVKSGQVYTLDKESNQIIPVLDVVNVNGTEGEPALIPKNKKQTEIVPSEDSQIQPLEIDVVSDVKKPTKIESPKKKKELLGADEIDQARAAGYSEEEIETYVQTQTKFLLEAGYPLEEIKEYFGTPPVDENTMWENAKEIYDMIADEVYHPDDKDGKRPNISDLTSKAFEAGFQISVSGLISRGKLPDLEIEDPALIERLSTTIGMLTGDVPAMLTGAIAMGGPVAYGTKNPLAATMSAGGGAFMLPAMMRKSIMMEYERGSIDNPEEWLERQLAIIHEGAKGFATGIMTVGAGFFAQGGLKKLLAEVTTMVTVGKALEGEVPTPMEFIEAFILLGSVKGGSKVVGKGVTKTQKLVKNGTKIMQNIYAKTGKKPNEVLMEAEGNPVIRQEVLDALDPKNQQIPKIYRELVEVTKEERAKTKKLNEQIEAAQARIKKGISIGEYKEKNVSRTELYTELVDDLHPINLLIKNLTGNEKLDANIDPYIGFRFSRASAAKAELFLEHEVRKFNSTEVTSRGLKEILEPFKNDLDGLRTYALAKMTVQLAKEGKQTSANIKDAKLVVENNKGKYEKGARELQKYNDAVLDYLQGSGVVSKEFVKKIRAANEFYVPLFKFFAEDVKGKPKSATGSPLKKRSKTGSADRTVDPIESIIKNTYMFTQLADRNHARNKLVDLAEATEGTGATSRLAPGEVPLVRLVKTKMKRTSIAEAELKKAIKEANEEFNLNFTTEEINIFRPEFQRLSETHIEVFVKGQRKVYEVDMNVAKAINRMDEVNRNMFVKIASMPARTLRAGAIFNPPFILTNLSRDTVGGAIMSTANFIPFLSSIDGFISLVRKDTAFKDWLMSGGGNATMVSMDRQYFNEAMIKLTKSGSLTDNVKNVIKTPLDFLRAIGEVAENMTRLGGYKRKVGAKLLPFSEYTGRRDPKSMAEGGFESREITLDFARRGASMQGLNMISAFVNASVQATDRLVRAFVDRPMQTTGLALGYITVPTVLLWWANRDDERYQSIPQWQKDLFWHISTGDQPNDYFVKFPKPHLPGMVFGTMVERLLENFVQDNPDAYEGITRAILSQIVPPILPTVFAPIADQVFGGKLMGLDVMPLTPKRLEGLEPQYRYDDNTTELTKAIAMTAKGVRLSPKVLDNYISGWSGGLGTGTWNILDKILRLAKALPDPLKPERTWAEAPFTRSFLFRYPSANAEQISKFYRSSSKYQEIFDTFSMLKQTGQVSKIGPYAKENIENFVKLQSIRTAITNLRHVVELTKSQTNETARAKRQTIDDIYLSMIQIAEAGNSIYRQLENRSNLEE